MRFSARMVVAGLVAVVGVACARDNPATPTRESAPSAPQRTVLSTPTSIAPLQRATPLATNQTASATIGILGGTLTIPGAGLTFIVPPLALSSPTTISVTALAGSDVAYAFEPHGLRFLLPTIATQQLRATDAELGHSLFGYPLFVGYFADVGAVSLVTELLPTTLDLLGQTSTATIWHFSGYVWSSGRDDDLVDRLDDGL